MSSYVCLDLESVDSGNELPVPQHICISHITCDSFKIGWDMDSLGQDRVTHYFMDLNKKENTGPNKFKHKVNNIVTHQIQLHSL